MGPMKWSENPIPLYIIPRHGPRAFLVRFNAPGNHAAELLSNLLLPPLISSVARSQSPFSSSLSPSFRAGGSWATFLWLGSTPAINSSEATAVSEDPCNGYSDVIPGSLFIHLNIPLLCKDVCNWLREIYTPARSFFYSFAFEIIVELFPGIFINSDVPVAPDASVVARGKYTRLSIVSFILTLLRGISYC